MEINTQTKLLFHGVDVLNVYFNVLASRTPNLEIDINCHPTVFYPENSPNEFKIVMDVELKAVDCFDLTLRAIGNFEFENQITEDLKKVFINANAPAIMFPYIRAFVSTLTSNLGNFVGPIIIPTQFFKGELEESKN